MQAPCAPNSDRSRCRSAGSDDQEALPCRDQTRKRIALVHPLAAPSWTAPANHLSIRRNHGSPVASTRVLQQIRGLNRTRRDDGECRHSQLSNIGATTSPLCFEHGTCVVLVEVLHLAAE